MRRVLVADSHLDCRDSLVELLRLDGDLVTAASSFEEVLAAINRETFDFLIVDSHLGGSSPSLLVSLGERCRGNVAIMATSMDAASSERFSAAGIAILPKPLDYPRLRMSIETPMLRFLLICSERGVPPLIRVSGIAAPARRSDGTLRMGGVSSVRSRKDQRHRSAAPH